METTSAIHNGSIGDCWAAIPAMKEYYRKTGKKLVLYLSSGEKVFYYEGATHPTTDPTTGEMVMLNDSVINMMIPLFKAQEFIHDCKIWNKELININFNTFRDTFVNMPNGDLRKWQFITWPDLACDLSKQYIFVPDTEKDFAKGKIIVTRTERYLNSQIHYRFLKKYEKDVLFVGTELEYYIFKLRYGLNIERLIVNDFLELAQAIKQCKFHITNQTQAAQLSEGMKTPRVVELCKHAPNVYFIGENAFEFYAQEALEYYVQILNGETPKKPNNGFPPPPPLNL